MTNTPSAVNLIIADGKLLRASRIKASEKRIEFASLNPFFLKTHPKTSRESLLKITSFKITIGIEEILDSKGTKVDVASILLLARTLRRFKLLEELEIEIQNVLISRENGLAALIKSVSSLKRLRSFRLRFTSCLGVDDRLTKFFNKSLSRLKGLNTLEISNLTRKEYQKNIPTFTNKGISRLVKCIRRFGKLKNFMFGLDSLSTFDASLKSRTLFRTILKMRHLEYLNLKLRGMSIANKYIEAFEAGLGKLDQLKKLCLDFRKKQFEQNVNPLGTLVKLPYYSLMQKNTEYKLQISSLKALSIGFTIGLCSESSFFHMEMFAQSIRFLGNLNSLEILFFGDKQSIITEKMSGMLGSSLETLVSLRSLVLEIFTDGQLENSISLVESICKLKELKRLKLSIPMEVKKDQGLMNKFFTKIAKDSVVSRLSQCLPNLTNLEDLSVCMLGIDAFKVIVDGDEGFFEAVAKLQNLKRFEFVVDANMRFEFMESLGKKAEKTLKKIFENFERMGENLAKLELLEDLVMSLCIDSEALTADPLVELINSVCDLKKLKSFKLYVPMISKNDRTVVMNCMMKKFKHIGFLGFYNIQRRVLHH